MPLWVYGLAGFAIVSGFVVWLVIHAVEWATERAEEVR